MYAIRSYYDVDRVRAHPLGGELERHPRARGRLEEDAEHGAAAQRRHLLDGALGA